MAPPRPGWSRRAQYGLFFSFIALVAGIIVGLILLAISLLAPDRFASLRGAALDATAPITSGLNEVSETAGGLVGGAGNYWDAARQNGKLKQERDAMRQQLVLARTILQENQQLKATLRLRERSPGWLQPGVSSDLPSAVSGGSPSCPREAATVSRPACRSAQRRASSARLPMSAVWRHA
ncbi:hypothetical protein [Sphingomonas piscis]|uniref:hypothetical protein n=1 Tax=Sphingomonas piscis TaxID=2714943 RepID=UPI001FE37A07|nr:hypothetical protein [Sphingomonas piscis]